MAAQARRHASEEPEHPVRFAAADEMPSYWPPRPSRFWSTLLNPLERVYSRRAWLLSEVRIEGLFEAYSHVGPGDSVLIAPNHSFEGDAFVLRECSRLVRRRFYTMAAWEAFRGMWGIKGFLLQRMGCFSVDREASDRRAVKTAVDILTRGETLVLFPEGEIHHLNERLTPILDGAAFMALTAQRQLRESGPEARVWIFPAAIRYSLCEDVRPQMEAAIRRLEKRMFWLQPPAGATLRQRVLHFGEMLLTLKEKEKLGRSREDLGDLPTRISNLLQALLERHETEYLGKSPAGETVALRVKALRRKLHAITSDPKSDEASREAARRALGDVQLALQLFSYPGNYIHDDDSVEAIAETIEKYQEDVFGSTRPIGRRKARIVFAPPIDVREASESGRSRQIVDSITARLEEDISSRLGRAF